MNTVSVKASKEYDIHIGSGTLSLLPSYIGSLKNVRSVCIVSDSVVASIYAEGVLNALRASGLQCCLFSFPSGEAQKNGYTYLELLQFLAENRLTRTDLIIALGGGVVGDLAGFAAATYLRGIRFVQIPTTLLAAVDSSVGGKTAIDLPGGKNLAGAFYQPSLVLCDTQLLHSLPDDIFRDGCAEVIKYAILYDEELFCHLQKYGIYFDREYVITKCIEWKRNAVEADEFDTGLRMKLNLGHTFGHAVEANSNFTLSHGCAVAIGTALIARAAAKFGYCSDDSCNKIIALLETFGLPTATDIPAQVLLNTALSDKKITGKTVHLIIPRSIGACDIIDISVEGLLSFIQAGM